MARRPSTRAPSFADVVREVRATPPPPPPPVRPGSFDRDGLLATPGGVRLARGGDISAGEARRLVDAGALLAFDGCGCDGGCELRWVVPEVAAAAAAAGGPRAVRGYGSPTWIDTWVTEDGAVAVVLAHGDLAWGRALL